MAAKQSLVIASILLLAIVASFEDGSAQDLSDICDFVGRCDFSDECPKACTDAGLNPDGSLCLPDPNASPNSTCCCVKPSAAPPPA